MKLSIVSPVYKAAPILPALVERIASVVGSLCTDYEIILVDDGCPQGSWPVIENLCKTQKNLKAIKLSRNFGQHHAITAGLDHVTGDWVVVMDCDLQDQPEEIPRLFHKAMDGYDIVLACRYNRQDRFIKRMFSKLFYQTLSYLTGSEQDASVANFGIYSAKVVTEMKAMRESIRNFPTMVKWVGFSVAKVDVEHAARESGRSSYSFRKMLFLALDIILAYSDKPVRIMIKLGFIISFIAILMSLYTIGKWFIGGVTVIGYASLITSIWLLSGFIIMTLGVIGLYIGKIFEGVKGRPLYIIEKTIDV